MKIHIIRVAIYARYSSDNQHETSITDQVSCCMRYINQCNACSNERMIAVRIYVDRAKSGTDVDRDGYKDLMDDARRRIYDIVLSYNTSRMHRNLLNALGFYVDLIRSGRDYRSATQEDINDPTSDMRLILYAIHAREDEAQSKHLSQDVKRRLYAKAERGHPLGVERYGWNIIGAYTDVDGVEHKGDRYEINDDEAAAVRRAYQLRRRRWSAVLIADKLADEGYLDKGGSRITATQVTRMLKDEAYRGVYTYGDVRIEGGIPAIVSDREWRAVQDIVSTKRKGQTVKHRKHIYPKPGMRFGELEIIERAENKGIHGRWLCKCNVCGGTKVEYTTRLTSGKATSCGCVRSDATQQDLS